MPSRFGEQDANLPRMRVVSLCPSTTETLLGLGVEPVGRTRFCIHPADRIASVPSLGGTKDPKLERIAALEPDLIFMNAEENRAEDHAWLAERFEIDVSMPRSPVEVPALLRRWGKRLDRVEPAEKAARAIEARVDALSVRGSTHPFLYFIWRRPWMVAGRETYVDALLRLGGGRNVETRSGYVEIEPSDDELMVLLSDEPFPFKAQHQREVQALMPSADVRLVGGDDLCWHGIRTIRGLDQVAALFSLRPAE
ncbi:MAG: helical backbone metal receptor [Myxococcota bacterium]